MLSRIDLWFILLEGVFSISQISLKLMLVVDGVVVGL